MQDGDCFNILLKFECLSVNSCIQAQWPKKSGEGVRFPGTGVTDDCEPLGGFWDLNLGPLQEQNVLLTNEPSLQPEKENFE